MVRDRFENSEALKICVIKVVFDSQDGLFLGYSIYLV